MPLLASLRTGLAALCRKFIICIRLPDYAYYINGPETLPPPLSKEEEKVVFLPAWRPETPTAAMCLSFTICGWWSTSQKNSRAKRPLWRT